VAIVLCDILVSLVVLVGPFKSLHSGSVWPDPVCTVYESIELQPNHATFYIVDG
jgi:hypothetical protein